MDKIVWSPSHRVNRITECNNCNWMITNQKEFDEVCSNCGKSYKETKSLMKHVDTVENGVIIYRESQ